MWVLRKVPILDFYPRSPCGERLKTALPVCFSLLIFLSTLSLRRATACMTLMPRFFGYFYPRSPCGERLYTDLNSSYGSLISIHALLAESDGLSMLYDTTALIFLSTLSLRRATISIHNPDAHNQNFYPRSPCGERPLRYWSRAKDTTISIHALLAESDALLRFQSFGFVISIHALLAESDLD